MTSENTAALNTSANDGEAIGALAYALELLVGTDALHSLCQQEGMDVLGRVKGTWSAAAEANARATLKVYAPTIRAALAKHKEV